MKDDFKCPNCGENESHFMPACMGDPGFFTCKPLGVCKTCDDKKMIENSTSGIAMGGYEMVRCPTCTQEDKIAESQELTEPQEFFNELAALLKKHKVTIVIGSDGKSYGLHSGVGTFEFDGRYEYDHEFEYVDGTIIVAKKT